MRWALPHRDRRRKKEIERKISISTLVGKWTVTSGDNNKARFQIQENKAVITRILPQKDTFTYIIKKYIADPKTNKAFLQLERENFSPIETQCYILAVDGDYRKGEDLNGKQVDFQKSKVEHLVKH